MSGEPLSEQLRKALLTMRITAAQIVRAKKKGDSANRNRLHVKLDDTEQHILAIVEKITVEAQTQSLETADCWLLGEHKEAIAHRLVHGEDDE